ncbi:MULTISPECIES: hypothetical protein [unclassified Sphingopyxis]|uniref:hypothetical protein n=1 Tax=unclassified Sphingopyxis TaxID=2614943 RepID=UPI000730AAA3|nr:MULTISPECIES: hypothetical protein [unclassified Sphingopyxis]KTE27415.1 hypothetical protein ATE61_05580 [Sphingopyxis sp. H057]KTE54718.1 hypothetical protein ATE64_05575 [Sphingopyxis sp. H073]KTE57044.1 hypothetical protein ATE69_05560 [Sphingopyxis sp. H071]KTE60121.1 hypothetical protein ATE66_09580 [Sphingopyxis sp. H107]KTE67591.1 hypothetical protein ATE60_19170 [Sphingopyxis sp. H081]
MEPTESLAYFIADSRHDIPAWDSYFAANNWIRSGLPDLDQSGPQLTIDGGEFTTVEDIKGEYVENTFVKVSLWFEKPANSKDELDEAKAISANMMQFLHEQITPEGIRIEGQGRDVRTDLETGLGRIIMSFRLMEV